MAKHVAAGAGRIDKGQNAGAAIEIEASTGSRVPPTDHGRSETSGSTIDSLLLVIDFENP